MPGKGLLRQVGRRPLVAEVFGSLRALVKRAVGAVRLDLLLCRDARRVLVASPGGIDGERGRRSGGESQRQGDGRDRAGSDDLRLMRKGIGG